MKKILKISLFIIVFCLLLILFSNSKVQAVVETVTTVQQLQEVMGATEHSTIDGTTLKITDNFTWTMPNNISMRITEITIDFNGKEIRIENNKDLNDGIHLLEGKVTLKDSQGKTGGIYTTGNFIYVGNDTELIIENGKYTAAHVQEVDNGLITNIDNGIFRNEGGNITVKNGNFNTLDHAYLFLIKYGKITVNDGDFTGKGNIFVADGGYLNELAEIIINGGEYDLWGCEFLRLFSDGSIKNVVLNGGSVKSSHAHCIGMNGSSNKNETKKLLNVELNGCILESTTAVIVLNPSIQGSINTCSLKLKNGIIKTTGTTHSGAIQAIGLKTTEENAIEKLIEGNDASVLENIGIYTERFSSDSYWELTKNGLVFENGKLILATDDVDNIKNNIENNMENNTENKVENNVENNTENKVENNIGNNTKLPQTGEETNTFVTWLSIAISLGLFWLCSMLLIEHEKKKMIKR